MSCMNVGGMENILHLIERQRERKANRSAASSHNSSGSDVHDSAATFTVGTLDTTRDIDKSRHTSVAEPQQAALSDMSRLQPHVDETADRTVNLDHIRHPVNEPVTLRSEANSLWRKDDAPNVIPRKVASVPVCSYPSTSKSVFIVICHCLVMY